MGAGSAHIRSPEVLLRFRDGYRKFDKRARRAVELVTGDLQSVGEWLHREQLPYWRAQVRRRHDEMKQAWRDYLNARFTLPRVGRKSTVDERKAYERARARKAEAERKVAVVEHWLLVLEAEAEKLMPAVRRFESLLDDLSPKALARLDHMLDRLEDYLGPSGRRGKEGGDAADQPGGADAHGSAGGPGEGLAPDGRGLEGPGKAELREGLPRRDAVGGAGGGERDAGAEPPDETGGA